MKAESEMRFVVEAENEGDGRELVRQAVEAVQAISGCKVDGATFLRKTDHVAEAEKNIAKALDCLSVADYVTRCRCGEDVRLRGIHKAECPKCGLTLSVVDLDGEPATLTS